jgi:hypothetical protein
MSEHHDPILESLFADAEQDLQDADFTAQVISRIRRRNTGMLLSWVTGGIVLMTVTWLVALPLGEFGRLAAQALTSALFDLGSSWPAGLLAPINNVGSLLLLALKVGSMTWKKIRSASWAM